MAFDEAAGLGRVRDDEGGREFLFHCTRLLDGRRTIVPGVAVTFRLVPRPLGTWEAADVAER